MKLPGFCIATAPLARGVPVVFVGTGNALGRRAGNIGGYASGLTISTD